MNPHPNNNKTHKQNKQNQPTNNNNKNQPNNNNSNSGLIFRQDNMWSQNRM